MHSNRNRLLVALVLFGVLIAGVALSKRAAAGSLGYMPGEPIGGISEVHPGSTPNSGEPDVPQTQPQPTRTSTMQNRARAEGPGLHSAPGSAASLADLLRWTWAVWQAQYLGRTL